MICSVVSAEEIAHIDVGLFFFLLLLFLLWLSGSSSTGGGSSSTSGSWGRADVSEKLIDVLTLESLDEESWPVAFDADLGGAEDLVNFLLLNNAQTTLFGVSS